MHTECNFCTRQKIELYAKALGAEMIVELLPPTAPNAKPVRIHLRYPNGDVVWTADLLHVPAQCVCNDTLSMKVKAPELHCGSCTRFEYDCIDCSDALQATIKRFRDSQSQRVEPTPEWLAASRARNHVPQDWMWFWCSNPECSCIVWVPPMQMRTEKSDAIFLPVCSPECTVLAVQAQGLLSVRPARGRPG